MSLRLRPASCVLLSILAFLSQRHLFIFFIVILLLSCNSLEKKTLKTLGIVIKSKCEIELVEISNL